MRVSFNDFAPTALECEVGSGCSAAIQSFKPCLSHNSSLYPTMNATPLDKSQDHWKILSYVTERNVVVEF